MVLCSPAARAVDIYVDVDATGANDGTSWGDAFRNLRVALASAENGDVVRIAQGTYRPAGADGVRSLTFEIPDGVRVVGGYAGGGEVDPDAFDPQMFLTILSGDLNGNDGPDFANNQENSFHVVIVRHTNAGTVLRGVTVTGGNGDDSQQIGNESPGGMGGGIASIDGMLTIRDCIIEGNIALTRGGGIAVNGRALHMRDCIVRGNETVTFTGTAGGVAAGPNSTFIDCLFEDNFCPVGSIGGALRVNDATIERCVFIDNAAGDFGGAVLGDNLTIVDSQFTENSSGAEGGALHLEGHCIVRNCVFDGNTAVIGGAIWLRASTPSPPLAVVECDFISNSAETAGAIRANSPIEIFNCRFLGNTADSNSFSFGKGGAVQAEHMLAVNCLFSGNTSQNNGAAISAAAPATLVNCTVVRNDANLQGGTFLGGAVAADSILNVRNCILWGNTGASAGVEAQQLSDAGDGVFRIRHSIIEGWTGDLGGAHSNGNDPQMIDPDGADDTIGTTDDNTRLGIGSPARNTGRNDFLPRDDFDLDGDSDLSERISEDLDGSRRIRAGTVDRGAYETTGS
jgi:predicted outer membrane repeat protein